MADGTSILPDLRPAPGAPRSRASRSRASRSRQRPNGGNGRAGAPASGVRPAEDPARAAVGPVGDGLAAGSPDPETNGRGSDGNGRAPAGVPAGVPAGIEAGVEAGVGNGRDSASVEVGVEAGVEVGGEPEDRPALGPEELLRAYRTMFTARELDRREIALKRQNRSFFQISSAGHEAVTTAAGALFRRESDWALLYYRDRAFAGRVGMTPTEQLAAAWGAAADPASGGRQMPSHFVHRPLRLAPHSSCVGTQFLHAAGIAYAERTLARNPVPGVEPAAGDGIVLVCGGDGATSEGEFWEALNTACLRRLPVVFLIEDNGYAISVPVEHQTAGGAIAPLVGGFPDLRVAECDGCDYPDSHRALAEAFAHARSGAGPALVHARVERLDSHSLSDEERDYRTAADREAAANRDPLRRLRERLTASGAAGGAELDALEEEIRKEVADAAEEATTLPWAPPSSIHDHLYASEGDPCSAAFATEPRFEPDAKPGTMVDLINTTLRSEMERDPRIVVFGQDVADASREETLTEVKGKGGVFKVSHGLQREFGSERVFNTPLAEATIVGLGVGMAVRGLRPVAEVQFLDYLWPAYMQIRNEMASLRWRSVGAFECPMVLRVPSGGYLTGGAVYHSQSAEVLFTHLPGLRVVMPATALDAAGLLRTAIRCDDPVIFLEHKHLYRQTYNKSADPGPDFTIPFGKARVVRAGEDLTVVTFGALVHRAELAAKRAAAEGVSVEILDLRSLSPYDWEAIRASVGKTNRVLVAYEDTRSFGYGAEIAARIADELFDALDAPVRRVAAADTWVAYNPGLEAAMLPQTEDLLAGILELAEY